MKRQKIKKGAIVKIPFDQQFHTYGRLLIKPYIEIYDFKTETDVLKMDEIIAKPVLFTLCVFDHAITSGRWEIIGTTMLDDAVANIPKQFLQDVGNYQKCRLIDADGNITAASIEECRELERSAVWEPEHIEDRIRDYYAGKPNIWVESLKLKEKN